MMMMMERKNFMRYSTKSLRTTLKLLERKRDFKTNSWEQALTLTIIIIMTMMSEQQSLPYPET
jgi:hypothetical protein